MKKLFLLFFLAFFLETSFAQNLPYFSLQKTPGGLIIGTEIINPKTGTTLLIKDYRYEWVVPDVSLVARKSNSNFVFIPLENSLKSIFFKLKVSRFLGKESYSFQDQRNLEIPKAKIVLKRQGILLPLTGLLQKNDVLTVIIKDFSSKNFEYFWDFNGVFVSRDKEIPVSLLKESSGIIRVRVFGSSPKETAVDLQGIRIE